VVKKQETSVSVCFYSSYFNFYCAFYSWHTLKQEAQLPLRNRASAVHFFVAELLYSRNYWILRLSRPKLKSDERADLLRIQPMSFSYAKENATAARALARDLTVAWRLLSREPARMSV